MVRRAQRERAQQLAYLEWDGDIAFEDMVFLSVSLRGKTIYSKDLGAPGELTEERQDATAKIADLQVKHGRHMRVKFKTADGKKMVVRGNGRRLR
jgi:hypothetical protein